MADTKPKFNQADDQEVEIDLVDLFAHLKQHFERDGVFEFAQVQPHLTLHFVQPVNQGVAVNVQLTGGIGQIQILFEEHFDGIKHFFAEQTGCGPVEQQAVIMLRHLGR